MYTYAIRHRMCYFHQEHAKRRFVPTHDSYKGKCYHSASYSTKVSLINSYEEKPSNNRVNKSSKNIQQTNKMSIAFIHDSHGFTCISSYSNSFTVGSLTC